MLEIENVTVNRSDMTDDEYIEALERIVDIINKQSLMLAEAYQEMGIFVEWVTDSIEMTKDGNSSAGALIEDIHGEAERTMDIIEHIHLEYLFGDADDKIH